MSRDFRSEITTALMEAKRSTNAWLGAVRFVVYSTDLPTEEPYDDGDDSGRKKIKSDVQRSADGWYEALNDSLIGAFKSAEGALSNEWMKRRDPRHVGPEAEEDFAHKFEYNIALIARTVLEAEKQIDNGAINESKQMRDSIAWIKADLKTLVKLYEEHLYELTMAQPGSDLLSIRSQIMDGRPR